MSKPAAFLPESQSRLRNVERLLPSQPVMRQFFSGGEEAFYARLDAVISSVLPVAQLRRKWDFSEASGFSYEALGSDLSG